MGSVLDPKESRFMTIRFPNESAEYRTARNRLLQQEIELRRAMEDVAVMRRALPPGGVVPEDYAFQGKRGDGSVGEVRLSALFAPGKPSLAIYSFMFPRASSDDRPGRRTGPTALLPLHQVRCPSCRSLLRQLDGAAFHRHPRMNVAVVANARI